MLMTTEVFDRHAVPVDEPAEPEVPERAKRRVFSAQYKLRILAEYERRDRDGHEIQGSLRLWRWQQGARDWCREPEPEAAWKRIQRL